MHVQPLVVMAISCENRHVGWTDASRRRMSSPIDHDLEKKTAKTCEKISENFYIIANEPTLACYRIQEHICKSGPQLAEKWIETRKLHGKLQGQFYGLDYTIKAIKGMPPAAKQFKNTQELLKNALFMKQQIDYEENVRMRVASSKGAHASASAKPSTSSQRKSAFQRFSGSFDIPSIFNTSFGIASSASADLKDIKTALSQFASSGNSNSSSPNGARRDRAESLSAPKANQSNNNPPS